MGRDERERVDLMKHGLNRALRYLLGFILLILTISLLVSQQIATIPTLFAAYLILPYALSSGLFAILKIKLNKKIFIKSDNNLFGSIFFSLALAWVLTPEITPVIISSFPYTVKTVIGVIFWIEVIVFIIRKARIRS